jgi:hypothetical protein
MAQVETFIIRLKDMFSGGIKNAERDVDGLRGKVGSLKTLVAGGIAGYGLMQLGNSVVSTLAEFEKFEAVLTNTLGSNSAAQRALDDITDFAAKTPFAVDELTGSFVKLANQNFVPTMEQMTKLGDLAASTGKSFDQLSEAVLDAKSGEFERLKEFGIKTKKSGDELVFSFKGVQTQVKNNDKAIQEYLLSLGDLQGVSGAMAAISGTTGGQLSNLGDSVTQLYLKIGQELKPVISSVIGIMSTFVGWIGSAIDFMGRHATVVKFVGGALAGLAVAIGLVTFAVEAWAMGQAILNIVMTANPIGLVVVAIGALIGMVVVAYNEFEQFRAVISGVWASMQEIGDNIQNKFTEIPNMIIDAFLGIPAAIGGVFSGLWDAAGAIFSGDEAALDKALADIGDNALKSVPITAVGMKIGEEFGAGAGEAFNQAYDAEITAAKEAERQQKEAETKKATEDQLKTDLGIGGGAGVLPTAGGVSGLGSGLSEVRTGAPKTFNINIDSLIKALTVNANSVKEGGQSVGDIMTKELLTALNDVQVMS